MSNDILVTGFFALLAAVLGAYAGYYFTQQSKDNRKVVEVSILPTLLVDPDRLGPLSMSVDKGFITGQPLEEDIKVPVSSAYNFTIDISNVGGDDLVAPDIDITLDENAIILPPEFKSDSIPLDKIKVVKDLKQPNYIRIIPQYINKQKAISISILSVNNKSSKCKVDISGLGIKQQAKVPEVKPSLGFFVGTIVVLALTIGAIVGMLSYRLFIFNTFPRYVVTSTPYITDTVPVSTFYEPSTPETPTSAIEFVPSSTATFQSP